MSKRPAVVALLLGLATYFMDPTCKRKLRPFTLVELVKWAPGLRGSGPALTTCWSLTRTGLISPVWSVRDPGQERKNPSNPPEWELTLAGYEAMRAARLEATSQIRSATMTAINKDRVHADSLPLKLWTVFRARGVITTIEAAEVLGNAGEDLSKLRKQIGNYMKLWHDSDPQHIQRSKRRVQGCFRYVLTGDAGRYPPAPKPQTSKDSK